MATRDHRVLIRGPIFMDTDSALRVQSSLEIVFNCIIGVNVELEKDTPQFQMANLRSAEKNATNILELMGKVRTNVAKWNQVRKAFEVEFEAAVAAVSCVTEALNARAAAEPMAEFVDYETAERAMDGLKTVLLKLVSMLEVSDEAPVLEITSRIDRCQDVLPDLAHVDANSVLKHKEQIERNHKSVEKAVNARLPIIQEPGPNRRLTAALQRMNDYWPDLIHKPGNFDVNSELMDIYDELAEAAMFRPPIIFEIDSDHLRAQQLLLQRPWRDRLQEAEAKLQGLYANLDDLLEDDNSSTADVAKVVRGIVAEVRNEAEIARQLAADEEWEASKDDLSNAANGLNGHAPKLAENTKGWLKNRGKGKGAGLGDDGDGREGFPKLRSTPRGDGAGGGGGGQQGIDYDGKTPHVKGKRAVGAGVGYAGGDEGAAALARLRDEAEQLKKYSGELVSLVDPNRVPPPSFLTHVQAVAKAVAALYSEAKLDG